MPTEDHLPNPGPRYRLRKTQPGGGYLWFEELVQIGPVSTDKESQARIFDSRTEASLIIGRHWAMAEYELVPVIEG